MNIHPGQAVGGIIAALGLATGGTLFALSFRDNDAPAEAPTPSAVVSVSPQEVAANVSHGETAARPDTEGRALRIEGTKIDVPITDVKAEKGTLVVPDAPYVGHYDSTMPLGSRGGISVLAGHVDTRQGGLTAMAELAGLKPGATVVARDGNDIEHTYVVTEVSKHPMGELPVDIFARTGAPGLALITCGGERIGEPGTMSYTHNVVVKATLVTS